MFVTRERLIAVGVALVLGCGAFVYGLRSLELLMTFRPDRMTEKERTLTPDGAESVWFNSADGTRLNGWFFKSQSTPATATVIFFHGNGGNIGNISWLGQRFAKQGFDVLLFDYRGYGASDGVAASESDIYADGDAAVDFVIKEKGTRPERIVLYGHSLGTAIVADVGSRRKFAGVVLESGFSSASSLAMSALPWLPRWLHFLGRNRFESAQKLARIQSPILIVHGDLDRTIPVYQSRLLFAAANEPKRLMIVHGGGHNVFGSQGEQYLTQIDQFIRDSCKDASKF
jgi:alpha-beta hydrolase superfamily lysophospholipase